MGESQLERRRAVLLDRSHLRLESGSTSFVFQLFHTSRPGTLDTSLVSTDNINNPRTMNAVYSLEPRLEQARAGERKRSPAERNNKQFNDYVQSGPLTQFYQAPDTVWTPRVLKDGRIRSARSARSTAST